MNTLQYAREKMDEHTPICQKMTNTLYYAKEKKPD